MIATRIQNSQIKKPGTLCNMLMGLQLPGNAGSMQVTIKPQVHGVRSNGGARSQRAAQWQQPAPGTKTVDDELREGPPQRGRTRPGRRPHRRPRRHRIRRPARQPVTHQGTSPASAPCAVSRSTALPAPARILCMAPACGAALRRPSPLQDAGQPAASRQPQTAPRPGSGADRQPGAVPDSRRPAVSSNQVSSGQGQPAAAANRPNAARADPASVTLPRPVSAANRQNRPYRSRRSSPYARATPVISGAVASRSPASAGPHSAGRRGSCTSASVRWSWIHPVTGQAGAAAVPAWLAGRLRQEHRRGPGPAAGAP